MRGRERRFFEDHGRSSSTARVIGGCAQTRDYFVAGGFGLPLRLKFIFTRSLGNV